MHRKERILIVDDDVQVRRGLRWGLEALAYEIEEAGDATAALDAARNLQPDAVLMDVVMPETGGLEVLARMKAEPGLAEIPVLILSAAADLSTKAAGFALGAQDYMLKSTDLREVDLRLKAAIAAVRRRERLQAEAQRLARERAQLAEENLHDPLTGLWNRRALERFQLSTHEPTAVLMADLDHFKRINDYFGHPAGDQVLLSAARFLQAGLREQDLCVRYGGEEFALILPGADIAVGRRVAERLRQGISLLQLQMQGQPVPVTVSVGVAASPGDGETMAALLAQADCRLYAAKATGRNCTVSD